MSDKYSALFSNPVAACIYKTKPQRMTSVAHVIVNHRSVPRFQLQSASYQAKPPQVTALNTKHEKTAVIALLVGTAHFSLQRTNAGGSQTLGGRVTV